jgi:hypothetical protein
MGLRPAQGAGRRAQSAGHRAQGAERRAQGSGRREIAQSAGLRMPFFYYLAGRFGNIFGLINTRNL